MLDLCETARSPQKARDKVSAAQKAVLPEQIRPRTIVDPKIKPVIIALGMAQRQGFDTEFWVGDTALTESVTRIPVVTEIRSRLSAEATRDLRPAEDPAPDLQSRLRDTRCYEV
jgi:hypothetical protein